ALAPVSANLPQALTGLDSGVAPVSVLPGVSFQNQDAKKSQVNLNTANQIQAAPLTNSNIDSGLGLSPQNLSQNGSAKLNLEEEVVSQALQGESKFKAIADSTSSVESILEKTIGSGVERSSSLLKTTFSEVQQKLDNAPYSTTVMTGLDEVEWGEEVGQKIVWLTGKAIQSAEIHLNPAELGPIDVKISVQNDAAAITFNAHNASVREMLESNVVRLREMMETNGVELQEVNVDARSGDERFASNDQQQGSNGSEDQQEDSEDSSSETATTESIS
ncbi:flagellar hook-length control protein FliK, partial [Oleiphilus sp. HI0132]